MATTSNGCENGQCALRPFVSLGLSYSQPKVAGGLFVMS
jgi:hypothetical protein